MRVGLLTCDQPWQRTLAKRLALQHDLALVVVDQHLSWQARIRRLLASAAWSPLTLGKRVYDKARVRALEQRDDRIHTEHFASVGCPPFDASAHHVVCAPDVNATSVADALKQAALDVIVVSGTRLIRSPVLDVRTALGMINLHTGLSPYYRGGPCTFWALYNEEPEYAGATVHHLTSGIDSGDIVLSAQALLREGDRLASLDCRVIETGHGLVLRALDLLGRGRAPRVQQWEKGRLFLYKRFSVDVRLDLERRLETGLVERCLARGARVLRTVGE